MRPKKDTAKPEKIITGRPMPKPKSCGSCPYIGQPGGCPFCQ